ncbi:MAG: type II secretion system F family protein, partial [Thermovirgaceae bacterium]
MIYKYRARNADGKAINGVITAYSQEQVVQQLRGQGLVPIAITQDTEAERESFLDKMRKIGTVRLKDKAVMFRQLATMISAGITLGSALDILAEQTQSKKLADAVRHVKRQVDSGISLSAAMRSRKEFNTLMVSIVKAGEEGGVLDSSLDRLATFLERQDALRKKIYSAVTYPAVVMSFALVVVYILVTFIVPRFALVFNNMGVDLPVITSVTFNFALWMNEHWLLFLIGILLFVLALIILNRQESTRPTMDRIKLKLPVVGGLIYEAIMARTNRTLSSLVQAGVPILMALEMTSGVANNHVVASAYDELREAARRGQGLGETAMKSSVFPLMTSHMMTVGEQTGRLEEMLAKVADWFEFELDEKIKRLTSIIEP